MHLHDYKPLVLGMSWGQIRARLGVETLQSLQELYDGITMNSNILVYDKLAEQKWVYEVEARDLTGRARKEKLRLHRDAVRNLKIAAARVPKTEEERDAQRVYSSGADLTFHLSIVQSRMRYITQQIH